MHPMKYLANTSNFFKAKFQINGPKFPRQVAHLLWVNEYVIWWAKIPRHGDVEGKYFLFFITIIIRVLLGQLFIHPFVSPPMPSSKRFWGGMEETVFDVGKHYWSVFVTHEKKKGEGMRIIFMRHTPAWC